LLGAAALSHGQGDGSTLDGKRAQGQWPPSLPFRMNEPTKIATAK
jgi:hypothetical protein